jgi:urea transporter
MKVMLVSWFVFTHLLLLVLLISLLYHAWNAGLLGYIMLAIGCSFPFVAIYRRDILWIVLVITALPLVALYALVKPPLKRKML